MILLIIALLSLNVCVVYADTQVDISVEEAISIIEEYEQAYMNMDLDKMVVYIDQNSGWFDKDIIEKLNNVFKQCTTIRFYPFQKKKVNYLSDGVEVVQGTLYVAYGLFFSDMKEFVESYFLKKVNDKYKISKYIQLPAADVEFLKKGIETALRNNKDEAILYLKKAIESNPQNSAAYCILGSVYIWDEKPQKALPELKKAIELRPQVGIYRIMLSRAHSLLGEKEKEGEEIREAIMLDPGLKIFFTDEQERKNIVLKSGRTYKGKIIERTDEHIRIDYDGVPITFFVDEIERIE